MPASAFEGFLSTPAMLALFEPASLVQAMLDFEAALATAQGECGVIPRSASTAIAARCRADEVAVDAIVAASGAAGSLAIPLVKQLTQAVARHDADAAGYVHWGSTSQDVIDTGMVLVQRRALALVDRDLGRLVQGLLQLSKAHGDAPVLARTLLQPAQVVSFGFKLVSWIAPLVRVRDRLRALGQSALQLQLGGAVGTLAVMGDKGDPVARHMALSLALRHAPGAWHTQRDEAASLACELGVLSGTLGKIARDISLMSQGEIGELAEPSGSGRGGSSAMPHKRNPVASMLALAGSMRTPHRVAAILAAMAQEHERGLGNWQAELAETAGLFISTHGALAALADVGGQLQVDRVRMQSNIDALQGLVFAEAASMLIARQTGKSAAHALLERLSQQAVAEGLHLRELVLDAVKADPHLSACIDGDELAALFSARHAAQRAIDVARPQLDALWATANDQDRAPPWSAWLPRD
ncbi:lyase family protein [Piscinibacter terrae]|uniref:3-carboxy-cis,cis-muconate cycloisomerase n=1 Tax=Piscinibacter terrae TaxID=2496871 RepID=A0A3N7HUS1_9BURK|nr:lyase family protein [Albitalea terrae]RQP25066.1 3-carboxy-cis,cis-muconate cycloisomerase [Albitalea terrae]